MGSQSYRDLIVWQKSIALCKDVYKACESFPRSELYGLADQMKRAAVSVASNIAEGQARQHLAEFRQFLAIDKILVDKYSFPIRSANGSLAELDTQRIIAEELQLIDHELSARLDISIMEVRKMLYALNSKLKSV